MPFYRPSRLTGLALKIVTIAVAVAAVYLADTLPARTTVRNAEAASPAVIAKAPRVAVAAESEVWAADESAAGSRPDASH